MLTWAMLALAAGCAAPLPRAGQPLPGLRVSGGANAVMLEWTPDSLAAPALRAGTTLDLVAEYPTAAGRVTGEKLATARVSAGMQNLRFTLPQALRNAPTGAVCLRLSAGGRALPIRGAGAGATDGFRYPSWERQSVDTSRSRAAEEELAALAAADRRDAAEAKDFASWKRSAGVADAAGCDTLTADAMPAPRTVMAPAEQGRAAQLECAWRLKQLKLEPGVSAETQADAILAYYDRALRDARARQGTDPGSVTLLTRRVGQARRMQEQLRAFNASAGAASFQPRLVGWELMLSSSASAQGQRGTDASVASGILDSYDSCLRDSEDQFRLARETWEREQDPRLARGRAEAAKAQCRSRFTQNGQMELRAQQRAQKRAQLLARGGQGEGSGSAQGVAAASAADLAAYTCG
ncbi:hypothetical protein ACKI2N_030140 [Cupriavidus sp. 30B13]|uniref:hypothetical protein n=1 Tax=Cupriavidus sp. 30B13 TaxID=3384241 RepID=UPI003B90AB4A